MSLRCKLWVKGLGCNQLDILSGTGFDEEAALLGAGREFALMKTASGKVSGVFYSNLLKGRGTFSTNGFKP